MSWFTVNPSTESRLKEYHSHLDSQVEQKLDEAGRAYQTWRRLSVLERCKYIGYLAEGLRKDINLAAEQISLEMGKPLAQSLAEVEKCAITCDYYSKVGAEMFKDQEVSANYKKSIITKEPIGIVLAIMPWNFPFWQVIRAAIPALLAGNVIVLKHAPAVQACAEWLEKTFFHHFPAKVLHNICLENERASRLIQHPEIVGVTFTGSSKTGAKIASLAGGSLKKCVLELGGSDPYLVFSDADLKLAAQICVRARFINAGQSCIAGKRFIVEEKVADQFISLVLSEIKQLRVGDALTPGVDLGPLAEKRFLDEALSDIETALKQDNDRLLIGGKRIARVGYFLEPTVFEVSSLSSHLFQKEIFAPIMPILRVQSRQQALDVANSSEYGLGAAIFSQNEVEALSLAQSQLQAGFVAVNAMPISDPRLPFGGVKNSGFGRELGLYGVNEFCNIKVIGIK